MVKDRQLYGKGSRSILDWYVVVTSLNSYQVLVMVDEGTKRTLASIPLLRTNAGPRDGEQWAARLKEEYLSLIKVLLLDLPSSAVACVGTADYTAILVCKY